MPKKEHTHKYMRIEVRKTEVYIDVDNKRKLRKLPGYIVFKCQDPGCNSYVPPELAIGKISLCWECSLPLILDNINTRAKKPKHEACKKVREVA